MHSIRTVSTRVFILSVLVLLTAAAMMAAWAHRSFGPQLLPEAEKRTIAAGEVLAAQIARALEAGVPPDKLVGVEDILADTMAVRDDLRYIRILDPAGRELFRRDAEANGNGSLPVLDRPDAILDTVVPVMVQNRPLLLIHLGVDRRFVDRLSRDLLIDIITVLVVSALCALEVLLFIGNATTAELRELRWLADEAERGRLVTRLYSRARDEYGRILAWYSAVVQVLAEGGRKMKEAIIPPGSGQSSATDPVDHDVVPDATRSLNVVAARLSIFIFALAEELSRPFFPLYVQEVAGRVGDLSPHLIAALPISTFMMVWALAQMFGAAWSEHVGRRKAFIIGAVAGAGGLAMTGMSVGFYDLVLWRCVTAVGYGVLMIAVQGIVVDNTDEASRARGFSMFVGGTLAAGICGPAFGGVLADQIGYRPTFVLGGFVALASCAVIYACAVETRRPNVGNSASINWHYIATLFRNRRFVTLVAASALPTKLAATGILFYLVPLFLNSAGADSADIGRALPLYFVGFMCVSPLVAQISDRLAMRKEFLTAGGVLSGIACLVVLWLDGFWAAALCSLGLGAAQALISAPQLALVLDTCDEEVKSFGAAAVLGVFRFVERMGSFLSPFLAAALITYGGYDGAIIGIGILVAVCALLFYVGFRKRTTDSSSRP